MNIGEALYNNGLLHRVLKPSRYVGGEFNEIKKENAEVKVSLCFPDVYEVGMSHTGYHLLYQLFNKIEYVAASRVFLPWDDMIREMEMNDIPLYNLENYESVKNVDMLAITLQYELVYTNVIKVLQLADIPVFSKDRTDENPIVIAGGPCVTNPEPVADFIDAFYIGDGEVGLEAMTDVLRKYKTRKERLEALSKIKGIYVPEFYDIEEINGVKIPVPKKEYNLPKQIIAQKVADLNSYEYPTKQIFPNIEIVHNRAIVEIMRGCNRGCRFCHAGMYYRPVRERNHEKMRDYVYEILKNTGFPEISLLSLSTLDYTCLGELLDDIKPYLKENRISISLPSSRVDKFGLEISSKLDTGRKTGLTFAPEAGSQRLRDVINKGINEEEIMEVIKVAKSKGWNKVKLYFMIGLPTETEEDVKAIVDLARKIKRETRISDVTINVSIFVPKSHTPFQYAKYDSDEAIWNKIGILKELRREKISFKYHEPKMSILEAILARGDRELSKVLYDLVVEENAIFQQWDERFDREKWNRMFEKNNLNYSKYLYEYTTEQKLPWGNISTGVTDEFLISEWNKAMCAELTEDCRYSSCSNCGVCFTTDAKINLDKKD